MQMSKNNFPGAHPMAPRHSPENSISARHVTALSSVESASNQINNHFHIKKMIKTTKNTPRDRSVDCSNPLLRATTQHESIFRSRLRVYWNFANSYVND